MIRCMLLALSFAVTVFMLSLLPADADGCAGVRRPEYPPIVIAEESAIIVWDSVKKVEHFIRRAAFDTPSPDFGFLVPTPGPDLPELKAMEDYLFKDMDQWIRPKIVEKPDIHFDPLLCSFFFLTKGMAPGRGGKDEMDAKSDVRVLAEQKVGGFETAVLEAENTDALSKWLTDNKYSNDPELQSWLAPYIAAKWRITAFKISQDPTTGKLATTKPVRMSFKTDRPFFPYREPEGKPEKKPVDRDKPKQQGKPAPTEIDGIWKVESAQGQDVTNLQGTKFWFVDGVAVGKYLKDTKYTVDPGQEPKWLDVGKMHGIYRLDDDGETLHWCRGTAGRPREFDCTKSGSLLVLRRDKKAEADDAAARIKGKEELRLHGGGRLLRVHFVSNTRMDGMLGNAAWHAKVPFADQLTDEQRKQIAKDTGIAENDLPAQAWLTTFEDRAEPRPGKDEVYFDPAQDQTPIRPADFIRYYDVHIPIDCTLVGVALVGLVGFTIFKFRHAKAA